jgi:hypothetical protein
MGGQAISLKQKTSVILPDQMLVIVSTPMGEQKIVVNGDRGVMSMGPQKQDMPGEMIAQQKEELWRNLVILASYLNSDELESVAGDSDEVDGTGCDMVAVTFRGTESRLCVAEDGKVLKQSYRGNHPMQRVPGTMELLFSDYHEVDGRMLPFKEVLNFEGEKLAETTYEEILIDPELSADLFAIPE